MIALNWLTRENAALDATPLSMLDTETGAGEVRVGRSFEFDSRLLG
ncbi:antitoxin Xre/MbcA/ParS toxin-binding domain-containing protein [Ferrovum sp.]